ncbi:HAD family hydrolase [Pseudaestuariivita atlantica]|uniref:HAD family hydrolase n=1 Tax=Pseudaestuariivita atlantica TaxID=1317121 RepID=UPI00067B0607|nr:HAD family phosphatase [Pseudaestuariivita atlantica]
MPHAGIIFDLDGTLVDSERHAQEAGIRAFRSLGVPADMEFMLRLVGKDFQSGIRIVRDTFGEIDFAALDEMWRADFHANLDDLEPKPGAVAALTHLRDRDIPVAVATSSRTEGARIKLASTGLASLVDLIVSRDDVTHAKPHPEPYLTAAARLGFEAATCLAVEDTPTGVASALAAGCRVLHVPDLLPGTGSPAHHVAPDLLSGLAAMGVDGLKPGGAGVT